MKKEGSAIRKDAEPFHMSQEGLEPPTYRFEVCHSIQLSYWPTVAYRPIHRVQYNRISANCQGSG